MIGAFARKFGNSTRVHEIMEGDEPTAVTTEPGGPATGASLRDNLPAQFVERVTTEAGDVVVAPFLESIRSWARKVRKGE